MNDTSINPFDELDNKTIESEVRHYKDKYKNCGRRKEYFKVIPGIDIAPEERYVVFGQVVINKPSLFMDNRLAIKYKNSLSSVTNFPSKKVSNNFKELIKTILDEQKINHKILSELSDDEKDLFYNLIKRAKLESKLGMTGYRTCEQDKQYERFELLKGQVIAGNNNKQILQELKQLIVKFMNDGTLSKAEGGQILVELLSII